MDIKTKIALRILLYRVIRKDNFILTSLYKKLSSYINLYANKLFELFRKIHNIPIKLLRNIYRGLPEAIKKELRNGFIYNELVAHQARMNPKARRFLKEGLTREDFFSKLNERGIRYVLLRWWSDFPKFPEGEDMDILIEDDDLILILDLLTYRKNNSPCDFYTVSGSNGGSYLSIPYFSKNMSLQLLNEKHLYKGIVYVPSPTTYFASLAYHCIYHKGNRSGIAGFTSDLSIPEHDYKILLAEAAELAGLAIEINVGGIVSFLKNSNLAPQQDTLTKLSEIRPELKELFAPLYCDARGGEILVFIVRERTESLNLYNKFERILLSNKIQILHTTLLSEEQAGLCSKLMRGGKWDRGPFYLSGGAPARLVIGYDYHPEPMSSKNQNKYTRVTNNNTIKLKYNFRNFLLKHSFLKGNFNGVHSADNEMEAFEYIKIVDESLADTTRNMVNKIRDDYSTDFKVYQLLSKGHRSKVELINYDGNPAVKKTFRYGEDENGRFFRRELFALENLSAKYDFIPPILKKGKNYFIIPYYENSLKGTTPERKASILMEHKASIQAVIKSIFDEGLIYINFTPENVIISTDNRLIAIDFEFLQSYQTPPNNVSNAYEVVGIPADFKGDLPIGFGYGNSSFWSVWEPWVGSWEESLLTNNSITN